MGAGNVDLLTRRIRVGTSGWSYPTWVGRFYPPRTTAARMLPFYAERFPTVEAHSTHRRTPTPAGLERWATQVPPGFRFALKAPMGITHRRDTDGLADRVHTFFDALEPLGAERIGPVLFLLPHRQPDLDRLGLLLAALAAERANRTWLRPVFELFPGWRVDAVLDRLADGGASLVVVDRDDDPGERQPRVGPVTYLRLRRTAYAGPDLDRWAGWLAGAPGEAYAYLKHDDDGNGPRYALDLVGRLERV